MIPDSSDQPRSRTPVRSELYSDTKVGLGLHLTMTDPMRHNNGRLREREGHTDRNQQMAQMRPRTPTGSPPIKLWDPIQAEQDKLVRKQEREDDYTLAHPSEEPLLLVHRRELTTKYLKSDDETDTQPTARIIKKSEHTRVAEEDYETLKQKMRVQLGSK